MEFNYETSKVIGIIYQKRGINSARIKVIGTIDSNKKILNLSEAEAIKMFPPEGFVFAPNYLTIYTLNDIILFNVDLSQDDENGLDKCHAQKENHKKYGIQARIVKGFVTHNDTVDLSQIIVENDTSDGDFYGITEKYIIGKLRLKNNKVSSVSSHRIKVWNKEDHIILSCGNTYKLHQEPSGKQSLFDCMDNQQLFDWFRERLRLIDPNYVNILDTKSKWRNEIPKYISTIGQEECEVEKIRFKRIEESISYINLSKSEIEAFLDKSENLQLVFKKAIESHKNEFREIYSEDLDEFKKENEKEKEILRNEINVLQKGIQLKGEIVQKLDDDISLSNLKLKEIEEKKDKIISDFNVIKDVLNFGGNKLSANVNRN